MIRGTESVEASPQALSESWPVIEWRLDKHFEILAVEAQRPISRMGLGKCLGSRALPRCTVSWVFLELVLG